MDDASERRCLIALHLTPALGPVRIARLVQAFGSAAAAFRAAAAALAAVPGIGRHTAALIASGRSRADVDRELHLAEGVGARVLTWLDVGYPAEFRGLRDAPPVVYLRGAWAQGAAPAIAVVGTRRATAYGLGIARALGEVLGTAGVVVVSGLARGIDGAAHAGALRARGVTVGVLGCGADIAYPAAHGSLMEAMLARGGVIAEAPMGTRPRRRQFPRRNRLISALSRAVVVVEGDVDSGALITARYAAAQGREVFAVPGSMYAPTSRGPHRLLAHGARILETPGDLLDALGLSRPAVQPAPGDASRAGAASPGTPEARVLAALGGETLHIDAVIARSGLGAAQAAGALAALEVCGLVRQDAGKRFTRRARPAHAAYEEAGGDSWPSHSSS